jgi:hypothetical protein
VRPVSSGPHLRPHLSASAPGPANVRADPHLHGDREYAPHPTSGTSGTSRSARACSRSSRCGRSSGGSRR